MTIFKTYTLRKKKKIYWSSQEPKVRLPILKHRHTHSILLNDDTYLPNSVLVCTCMLRLVPNNNHILNELHLQSHCRCYCHLSSTSSLACGLLTNLLRKLNLKKTLQMLLLCIMPFSGLYHQLHLCTCCSICPASTCLLHNFLLLIKSENILSISDNVVC